MKKGHNKLIKLGISGVLILGCCSLIFIDLYVQYNSILFIGNSLIVIIGMIYLMNFFKRYFLNQYLDCCQLSKLVVVYRELLCKRIWSKNIKMHMKILEYCIESGDYSMAKEELSFLDKNYNTLGKKNKEKFMAYAHMASDELTVVEYCFERKDTQEGKAFLKSLNVRSNTYDNICKAYWNMLDRLEKGDVTDLPGIIDYIVKNGGETLYVEKAQKIKTLNDISDADSIEYHKCGVSKGKELGIVFLFFITAIIVLNFVIFNPKGNSVATAYSNYYRIDIKNIHVLQQENLGQREFAIIYDGSEIAYCIFDKTKRNDSDSYVIKKVYKFFKDDKNQKKELSDLNIYNERIDFYQNSSAAAEIETIVIDFYIKEGILSDNSNQCKGYSLYPYISNITVKGGNLSVTPVKVSSDCLYMWTISDVNIGELDYFDFSYY